MKAKERKGRKVRKKREEEAVTVEKEIVLQLESRKKRRQ